MSISARNVMRPVVTLPATATAADALRLLLEVCEDTLYVTNIDGSLIGVLPDYEVLKSVLAGRHKQQCVAELLSTNVQTIDAETLVYQVAASFRAWQTQSLAVIDEGRIVGRVGRTEILRSLTHTSLTESIRSDEAAENQVPAGVTKPPQFALRADDIRQRIACESV